jgi:hypothetical protein
MEGFDVGRQNFREHHLIEERTNVLAQKTALSDLRRGFPFAFNVCGELHLRVTLECSFRFHRAGRSKLANQRGLRLDEVTLDDLAEARPALSRPSN